MDVNALLITAAMMLPKCPSCLGLALGHTLFCKCATCCMVIFGKSMLPCPMIAWKFIDLIQQTELFMYYVQGQCLLTNAPGTVSDSQLTDLHIKTL
jgi:hypothetical protein